MRSVAASDNLYDLVPVYIRKLRSLSNSHTLKDGVLMYEMGSDLHYGSVAREISCF